MQFSRFGVTSSLSHWTRWWTADIDFGLKGFDFPRICFEFSRKDKFVVQPHNPTFSSSRGWEANLFTRHKLALSARTSIIQKLSIQLESVLIKFCADAGRFIRMWKSPFSLVGNIDETPAYFGMVPSKSIAKKGEREQTNQTTCNINIPPGFTFKTKQKASMGDNLMKVWTEDLWLKHTQAEFKRLRFQKPVLLSFAAHLADGVKTKLSEGNSDIISWLYFSWLYFEVATHAGLPKQTIQNNFEEMFGKVSFMCWRSFREVKSNSWFKLPVLTPTHDWLNKRATWTSCWPSRDGQTFLFFLFEHMTYLHIELTTMLRV